MDRRELPAGWDATLPVFPADAKGIATRASSGKILNVVAQQVPWLVGGSADLAPSTLTLQTFEGSSDFEPGNPGGRNLHFGIREHGMAAALNGLALSKIRPYGSTFFTFFDYCKPSFRLSAIGHLPAIYIFTHDSIGVGEDGPTHEPIEHLAAIRAVPRAVTIRPGDANEASEAWRTLMGINDRPVALILTRQNLPTVDRTKYAAASGLAKGAYVLADPTSGPPKVILIGTGSEVSLCVAAYEQLTSQGIAARVVSMPSWELFEAQPRNTAIRFCHRQSPPAWRSKPPANSAGTATSAPPAASSACTATAPARRATHASSTSALRRSMSWRKRRRLSDFEIPLIWVAAIVRLSGRSRWE